MAGKRPYHSNPPLTNKSEKLSLPGSDVELDVHAGPSMIGVWYQPGKGQQCLGLWQSTTDAHLPVIGYHSDHDSACTLALALDEFHEPQVQVILPGPGHELGRIRHMPLDELLRRLEESLRADAGPS